MENYKKITKIGNSEIVFETGKIARQATGAVLVSSGNTQVLSTVVVGRPPGEHQDFFPLTVNYLEKTYATGKIPGGFFKREGRPTEKETLTSRLIDRPIRPLFENDFLYEVQVICTVLSSDKDEDPDILSFLGASAALAISGLPFKGPLGAARVGFIEGQYVINPKRSEMENSYLDMVIAGSDSAVIMVESEAKELTEDQMLGGILFAHQEMQESIKAIKEMAREVGREPFEYEPKTTDENLLSMVEESFSEDITKAYLIKDKQERVQCIAEIKEKLIEEKLPKEEDSEVTQSDLLDAFKKIEKKIVRTRLLNGESRIDGRDLDTVRPIFVEAGLLHNTHGSALFTRGETQAIVAATLGSPRQAQLIDALEGEFKDQFMLHYNFPPYSVGEASFLAGPKRREIGHGKLARRALEAVLPDPEEFPYTIRVVSEITESNGSSSMASVCGSSLALMDAGIPIKKPVAGVAMGLVKENENFAVITDILGDEDHLGDMDFKVAGTHDGITSLQMDIKITSITAEIMKEALSQAKEGRLHILEEMAKAIDKPKESISDYAPTISTLKVHKDKIREVIGKGGAVIREISEKTGAKIEIDDEGLVSIAAVDSKSGQAAIDWVNSIVEEPEIGKVYEGKVVKLMDFGAFVNFMGSRDGLVHISQLKNERVEKVEDVVKEGDIVKVKVLDIDNRGKVKLSMKEVDSDK